MFIDDVAVPNTLLELTTDGNKLKVKFLGDDSYIGKILTVKNTSDDIETSIELSYTMAEDGILYPNISFETENLADLGKYGLMAMDYLKDNYYERYRSIEMSGRLVEVLKPINEEAHQMVDRMMEKYLQTHKPNDPTSTMEMWKIREQRLMLAEEIVVHDPMCNA